jgi:hypothetical protein
LAQHGLQQETGLCCGVRCKQQLAALVQPTTLEEEVELDW